MADVASAVKSVSLDVSKLETRIDTLISLLLNQGCFTEVGLHSFENESESKGKKTRVTEKSGTLPGFMPDESTIFLHFVDSKWIFGIVVCNTTLQSVKCPHLTMTVVSNDNSHKFRTDSSPKVFRYSVKYTLLPEKSNERSDQKDEATDYGNGELPKCSEIPHQDQFLHPLALRKDVTITVKPQCKALITAEFEHPFGYGDFGLLVSLFQNTKQWTKRFPITLSKYLLHSYNYNPILEEYPLKLLSAFCQYKDVFQISRSSSKGSSVIGNLEAFLHSINFTKVKTEQILFDTSLNVFVPQLHSPLWGVLFTMELIEHGDRDKDKAKGKGSRCSVSTRTGSQRIIFFKLFQDWLRRQNESEVLGGKKSTVVTILRSNDATNLQASLSREIAVLKKIASKRSNPIFNDYKPLKVWGDKYFDSMCHSDIVALNNVL